MLVELHLTNLGVIDSATVMLGEGLTVLTGETGAGKTMVVEALQLLLGGRADASVIRHGCDEARVEGRFVRGDDEMVLCRVVPSDGRSRAYINGRLATATSLAELGAELVELHGQHAHQQLVTTAAQREALDAFAATDLTALRAARAQLAEIDAALAALGGDARSRARELDLLRFQASELRSATLAGPDEDDELSELENLLSDAAAHAEAAQQAHTVLADEHGAIDAIGIALAALGHRSPFAECAERLRSLAAELSDVARDIADRVDSIDDDPARLDAIRERRKLLYDLRRKYGETLGDVIEFGRQVEQRLAELEGYEHRVDELERQRRSALAAERNAAVAVATSRRAGAPKLAAAIERRLRALAMEHARLEVSVGAEPPGDDVTLLLAANAGGPLQPFARVASGGELARTMLAVRLVLSGQPDTMVFDEVDAGIGGAAANAVAEALADLATTRQVVVVTHFAQVAALADLHLVVSKRTEHGVTTSHVAAVHGDERAAEVARMLSGDPQAASAVAHASDLLTRAEQRLRRA